MREKVYCVRRAKPEDLAAITAIYNEAVLNSLATFHIFPRSE
ncbi:MAG: Acetyltransferase domain, partial [Candidatus Atribacteria bacterium]|nr:Acetyltransferase domain [Candidatus Atribacteria bacterium]